MRDKKLLGDLGEAFAEDLLFSQGWTIRARKFRCGPGEVDLVCERGREIAFVEVKTRTDERAGPPAAAVDRKKQARIRWAARAYLQQAGLEDRPVSFQVIGISVTQIPNAF